MGHILFCCGLAQIRCTDLRQPALRAERLLVGICQFDLHVPSVFEQGVAFAAYHSATLANGQTQGLAHVVKDMGQGHLDLGGTGAGLTLALLAELT
jgi:hypothetical protein